MKIVKSILYKAAELGIIEKVKFENYKAPRYSQPIPEYLTETEITAIAELLPKLGESSMKTSGYYFLLSCFTGYRISDAKRFDYDKHVKDGTIVLRAKKNKSVVSIPVHDRLKDVLEFVKRNPLTIPEQNIRDYVRDVCKLAGITKHVKYHTSRHSWAMLLMNNGFSQEEVAETLGDSLNVARIYARISPERLNDKIMSKLNGAQKKPLGATQEPK
jgi:site-specific recombinase XerD